ncbi:MAG: aminotransferase class V-fold PLP-dependent enzyme [Actinobacteria bacterium]|nr:aminotransferase class V-fold PLP-dependent enzyme [Actinomycetota bacterium]MSY51906.1 aminotransferase class V-fold PLP-dependent enzyme [Actinomycetota bacterium]MTA51398.1 aminotransferase class V-fold PLP-dependent enzyme [Actinomycetota bacterium]
MEANEMSRSNPLTLGADREAALHHAAQIVLRAWKDFDQAREEEHVPTASLIARLQEPLPASGMSAMAGLDLAAEVLDTSLAQSRPRYLAYIGSSGLEIGALADLLAHSYDVNLALDARAASLMDHQTLQWLGEFLGFPSGGGAFTSGGTISNITALVAARERAIPGSRFNGLGNAKPVVYCSADAHYSVRRGIELLGIGSRNVRSVPIDSERRLAPAALREMITSDISEGLTPIAVVATGGTTLIGAVDPIDAIADVCEEFGIWLHIDGAYGLPAAATQERASAFSGLARADSISIDAHKWMYVPKACSAVMVRDRNSLVSVFSHEEAYIPHDGALLNAVDYTLEYSRPLRALKLWLAFMVHGADEFRSAISQNLQQAQLLHDLATATPGFAVMPFRPALSIVPLRAVPEEVADLNAFNTALCDAIQSDGRVYLSQAVIDGEVWLRPCFTNFRTTEADVHETLAVIVELTKALRS